MNQIKTIITGHGKYATSMKSSLEMLMKLPENFIFIDFTAEMSDQTLSKTLQKSYQAGEALLIFTDLVGGTPFKVAAELAEQSDAIEVVAGLNIGALLETSFTDFTDVHEYAVQLLESAKMGMMRLADLTENVEEDPDNEGI